MMKLRHDFNRKAKKQRKKENDLNIWHLFWIMLLTQQFRMENDLQRHRKPILRYG